MEEMLDWCRFHDPPGCHGGRERRCGRRSPAAAAQMACRPAAVRDGYKDVYTNKLESIHGADIHFWHGTKETFVAKPQVDHLLKLCPEAHIEVFPKMNHGQLLVDHPEEVARRILALIR